MRYANLSGNWNNGIGLALTLQHQCWMWLPALHHRCHCCWSLIRDINLIRNTKTDYTYTWLKCMSCQPLLIPADQLCRPSSSVIMIAAFSECMEATALHILTMIDWQIDIILNQSRKVPVTCLFLLLIYVCILAHSRPLDIAPSGECTMVWKWQLNILETPSSHTDSSRCSKMLPDRLNGEWCALSWSRTTSPMLVNALAAIEQNTRISRTV